MLKAPIFQVFFVRLMTRPPKGVPMHTNNPRPAFSWLSAVAVAAVLSACGGGGSSANRYTIAGEVQGLGSDTSVVLSLNGSESLTLASSSTFELADSSTKRNKDEPGDGWLRMPRHHGRSNRQVQVARCTSTSAEKNDTKSTVS